jgi:hypothetical protein
VTTVQLVDAEAHFAAALRLFVITRDPLGVGVQGGDTSPGPRCVRRSPDECHGPAPRSRRADRALSPAPRGVYEYEDETFEFERGRLLLRGPNGSGKSKALELLLPLLLDGELRAERLDPFGGRGRSMRWNLIGDQESRAPATGFSWLELRRRDEHGIEHFHTLVLMARANKGETGVRSWFALLAARQTPDGELHGSRIGISAFLTQAHRPISKAALTELAGELIESASIYRPQFSTPPRPQPWRSSCTPTATQPAPRSPRLY